ncbi:ribonuclease J [Nitrosophilus alvini]|uniref:ribonuclease J n=1 Tax=Nitrosophilus alvini TaxID=2714855 RepID=UPI00190D5409|nr:ribonuclease J [Nitrosophilus alvini]
MEEKNNQAQNNQKQNDLKPAQNKPAKQQYKQKKSLGWYRDIKKAIEANERVQKNRLSNEPKYPINTKSRIKITPLGGLGEIGGNITVIETEKSAIIIDVGMSFPTEDMHGVDILVPDFTYLRQIKDKIAGIIITHAHEDHIGAVPYLFKEMQFPVYGTPLPLGMIANKFDEHNLRSFKNLFRYVEKRKPIKIGDFEVEWIHITHSIIDASALAISTEAGTIIHTGDFKIDHTPIDGYPTDLHRLAHYGEKGVLALLSDSTNSHNEGITKSESTVGPTFDLLFARAKGRVIMSTFSSNIHRVYQAIEHGIKYGRKVCVIGRSMERNLETTMQLGYIKLPQNIFIDAHEIGKYSDNEILIVTTGSQGETMSALYRMATNEHRHVKIKPSDTIIISAKAIPGNERSVSSVINFLQKCGATVAYQDFSEIHVSGHAAQEEQKLMLRLTKPKFFLPVHGEYNHLTKHKETAVKCGIPEKNIFLMQDGDQIELTPKYIKKVKSIRTGKTYIDNQINQEIESDVVIDRQKMATEGIVMIVAQISENDRKLISKPKVSSFGLVADKYDKEFAKEIEEVIEHFLQNMKPELISAPRRLENELRQAVRKHIFRKMKKYPTIVPTIFIM